MRSRGTRVVGIAAVLVPLLLYSTVSWSEDKDPEKKETPPAKQDATGQDQPSRLQVDAWVGEVINKYAASERINVLDPNHVAGQSDIDRFAGLAVDFNTWSVTWTPKSKSSGKSKPGKTRAPQTFGLHAIVKAVHTARTVEAPCAAGDSQCQVDNSGAPIEDPSQFFKIVKDSSVLEWHAGFRLDWQFRDDTVLYGKGMLGFVRSVDSGDDVIDDDFYGVGLRYIDSKSWFRNSFMEAGFGRTDLFAHDRTDRKKVDARLEISRPGQSIGSVDIDPSPLSFFLEGYLDSDFGSGPDDIRIFLGVGFDIRQLIDKAKTKNATTSATANGAGQ